MTLKQWEKNGWLKAHQSSPGEISDLLGVADRDLSDVSSPGLSSDWKLAMVNMNGQGLSQKERQRKQSGWQRSFAAAWKSGSEKSIRN